jgi:hypothetical protein
VQSELERLEAEEGQVKKDLSDIATRQAPVERVSDDAKSFLESWQDVGELLDAATPEERLQILQHYIEVVELDPIDSQTRTGSYAMRLFPDVPDRGFDFGGDNGLDDGSSGPKTTNGAVPANEDGSVVVNPGRLGSHNRPESPPSGTRTYNLRVNRQWINANRRIEIDCATHCAVIGWIATTQSTDDERSRPRTVVIR